MRRVAIGTFGGILAAAGLALTASSAQATTFYNMTGIDTASNPSTFTQQIGDAFFHTGVDGTIVGTGVLQPFVRIQNNGNGGGGTSIEGGFNTDGTAQFDTKDKGGTNWDHSVRLGDVGTVCGIDTLNPTHCFYQFVLDINESNNNDKFLSLDKFQVYLGSTPDIDSFLETAPEGGCAANCGLQGGATKIYDMDGPGFPNPADDTTIGLNYDLNEGSGKGVDLYAYVPVVPNADPNQYVYLYSSFGATGNVTNNGSTQNGEPPIYAAGLLPNGEYGQSAGFEEWATKVGQTPEPLTAGLLLIGLAALGLSRRQRFSPSCA